MKLTKLKGNNSYTSEKEKPKLQRKKAKEKEKNPNLIGIQALTDIVEASGGH
jgi:hypothetical protein